jgi:tRNA-2-methylthio-N6-dimethylallyladenosine synthase
VPDLVRIRFTTSHPQDLSPDLMQAFADVPQLMPHFHLPVQAGSNSVLERMRRRYTWQEYVGKLDRLRVLRPDIAMTSDIIVGFPGETDEDFDETMALIERVGYANLFSFVYSPRPHTSAIRHEKSWGPVPHEVSVARLARLQQRQREITSAYHQSFVGRTLELLVEGPSRTDAARRMGRTVWNHVVNFDGRAPAGSLARVRIDGATAAAMSGTEVDFDAPSIPVERPPARKLLQVVAAPSASACHDDGH